MKVVQGKLGWLFLDNDSNQIVEQITGRLTFSERKLYQWKLLLEMRNAWFQQRNISYYFLVAPNKACIYPECLPDGIQLSTDRCINQLMTYLSTHSRFKLLYPLAELLAAKQQMLTYHLADTHWNGFGAHVAYLALMAEISKRHPLPVLNLPDISFAIRELPDSDLGAKLGGSHGLTIEAKVATPKARCLHNNRITATGNLMIYENTDRTLPRAVLFRDSFADFCLDVLAESFSRLVVVWQPNLDYELIEAEHPHIVISEQVERFLIQIPDDLKGETQQERAEAKLKANPRLSVAAS